MQPTADWHIRLKLLARCGVALAAVAASAALLAPMLLYPFGRDQAVFACVADVIARGGVPYRDVWDIKPPGIYYLFSASFALFGRSTVAPRVLDVAWTLTGAAAMVLLGKRLLSYWAGVAASGFFLVGYALGAFDYWSTAQCEGFTSLPLMLAALTMVAAERRRSTWCAAASGALVATAITIKFTVGGFLGLSCIAALAARDQPVRARMRRAASYLAGCIAVLAVVAGLFWASGALDEMAYALFVWNFKYATLKPSPNTVPGGLSLGSFLFAREWGIIRLVGLLAVVGTGDLLLRRKSDDRWRWLPPAWAAIMVGSVLVQGKYFPYHWLAALPPVSLLAGQGASTLSRFLVARVGPRAGGALALSGVMILFGLAAMRYWSKFQPLIRYATGRVSAMEFHSSFGRYGRGDFSLLADVAAAGFVREKTPLDASIFIWGFEPLIYFLADRPPASRFIHNVPLVAPWSPPEWRRELVDELERKQPALILVVSHDTLWWVTGRPDDSASQLLAFREFRSLLEEHYQLAQRIEHFDIWELHQQRSRD